MDSNIIKIKATIAFPSLTKQNEMSGKYETQLANLSSAAVEKLEELGVNVKFKEDDYGRGQFIDCKSAYPIDNSHFQKVVDEQGLPVDPSKVTSGSKVEAVLKSYDWEFRGKTGVNVQIQKMVVKEFGQASEAADYEELDAL
jgi:hypothetical protein